MRKITLQALSLLIVPFMLLVYSNCQKKKKIRMLKENVETLASGIVHYRTADSLNAVQVGRLTLTKRELKERESELLKRIENMDIKIGRLNAVLETHSESKTKIRTVIRDSIINDTTVLKCLKFDDNYFYIDACLDADTLTGVLRYRDTLIQVLHRVPRKIWFIKFGTKAVRQDAYFANPNATITYSRYIELKK